MDTAKKVAQDLKELRIKVGMSQAELSRLSGYTQMTISTIETGRREPKIATVDKLAGVMGYKMKVEFEESEQN